VFNFCPNNDCVVAQIQISKGVLTDPTQPKREKVRALKFLVHFVGDLHQPLHAADDHDRGGNDKMVRFQSRQMKLHALWDGLIEKQVVEDPREFATRLQTAITPSKAKTWTQGEETDWAMEGYKIAKQTIYKGHQPGPQDLTGMNLGNAYFKQMRPIIEEQLRKVGVRLANILEEVFGAGNI
jgi:S1/P1 Nuclease